MNLRSHRISLRRTLTAGSLLIFSLIVGVAICETTLRVFNFFPEDEWPLQFQKYKKARAEAHRFANEHGYYEPHSVIPIYADGSVAFGLTDDLGYLGNNTPKPRQTDLLVFGDSFAYGYGVNSDKAFAAHLRAYNAGVWGEAFPFHSRVLKKIVAVIRPKRAIWVIYPPHLISCTQNGWYTWRTMDPRQHPFCAFLIRQLNKTRCSTLLLKTTGWGYNREDYESLEWSLYDATDSRVDLGYARFEESVVEVQRIANQEHIQITALFVPSKTQILLELNKVRPLLYPSGPLDPRLPTDRMMKMLEVHGIAALQQIDLMNLIRKQPVNWPSYYFKNDAHFNEDGNAAVADFITKHLAPISAINN